MLLQKLGDDRERKARYIQLLREQRVDGMIVVPDVAVATFDDDLFASYLETSLTSVYWPAFEIGRVAAQTLLRRIRGEVIGPPQRMLLEPTLIHRESTLGGTTVRSA